MKVHFEFYRVRKPKYIRSLQYFPPKLSKKFLAHLSQECDTPHPGVPVTNYKL